MAQFPAEVADLAGKAHFAQVSDGPVEAGAIRFFAAAVEDGCSDYWTGQTAGLIAPPALLSAWNRPLMWQPDGSEEAPGLALHFLVKQRLGLPLAVVTRTETELARPVRVGDRVRCEQWLVDVSEAKNNRLGDGRYWTIRVEYRCAASNALFGAEVMGFFGYAGGEPA
ncbi:MAG: MaoC family dehydratase N-terminal domain-containing protein [Sphingomonadaceae bacterium]|nr:MaoC family dehydratase N-terminal domain-containing protein [Sphingomonadaceae bacterium]